MVAMELIGWLAAGYLLFRMVLALLRVRWARYAYPEVAPKSECSVWQARCRGTLLGLAMGDALGLPAESLPRWLVRLRYPGAVRMRRGIVRFSRQRGDVSDDTQLSIAVARSVRVDGSYCHERFLSELALWSYSRIGAGRACTRAARLARAGRDGASDRSEGNGAAIRVAPLVMAAAERADHELIEAILENGRATHRNEQALRGAVFFGLLLKRAFLAPARAFSDPGARKRAVTQAATASGFSPRLGLDPGLSLRQRLLVVGTSGRVTECLSALVLVLFEHGLDFRAGMQSVFDEGGDTDSIGAMLGAIIGAQVGESGLPAEWSQVQHADSLRWLADRLAVPRAEPEAKGVIEMVEGDLASRKADALVNAWNRNAIPRWLLVPQGVSRSIAKAGGASALASVGIRAPLPLGRVTETRAGDLPGPHWILHVAGINLAWPASARSVADSTRNALLLARWHGARSVALPLIGAGSGGMNEDRVAALMLEELERHRQHFDRLELVRLPKA